MTSKDMVGLRMSSDEIARLDAEARRRGVKRAALIRTCIDETLVDPYQVLQNASQGEFSSDFIRYLVNLDAGWARDNECVGRVERELSELREWLLNNPYHPEAHERVRAVVVFSSQHVISEIAGAEMRLKEMARIDSLERVYKEIQREHAMRVFGKPEEDIDDGDE